MDGVDHAASPPAAWRLRPQAPEPGTALGRIDEIEDGASREFVFGLGLNAFRMFVVRRGTEVFGYLNLCPHYSLPLNVREDEFLSRDRATIMCRRHLAVFRIEDGFCVDGACTGSRLDVVPLTLDGAGLVVIA